MYEEFYGFVDKPFQIVPNPNYLYLSQKHKDALNYLEYGVAENVGVILLTGEIGSGKTTLVRYLMAHTDPYIETAVIFNTHLSSDQLLNLILYKFGLEASEGDKARNIHLLHQFLLSLKSENSRALLIIDEAQNLSSDALEEIRMLSNMQTEDETLLQIMLVGQPELRERLNLPKFAQIRQRCAVNYHLEAISREETAGYITHRLRVAKGREDIFTPDAMDKVYQASLGIPRVINLVCDAALIYGFADELETIDANVVEQAIEELKLVQVTPYQDDISKLRTAASSTTNPIQVAFSGPSQPVRSDDVRNLEAAIRQLANDVSLRLNSMDKKATEFRKNLVENLKKILIVERRRSDALMKENADLKRQIEELKKYLRGERKSRMPAKGDEKAPGRDEERQPRPKLVIHEMFK